MAVSFMTFIPSSVTPQPIFAYGDDLSDCDGRTEILRSQRQAANPLAVFSLDDFENVKNDLDVTNSNNVHNLGGLTLIHGEDAQLQTEVSRLSS